MRGRLCSTAWQSTSARFHKLRIVWLAHDGSALDWLAASQKTRNQVRVFSWVSKPTCKPRSVPRGAAIIYLSHKLPYEIKQHTRRFLRSGPLHCACLALLPVGFAWPPASLPTPVVSYTAVSPSPIAGNTPLCCTLPSGHPAWPLASTVPSGARTFLVPAYAATQSPGQLGRLNIIRNGER